MTTKNKVKVKIRGYNFTIVGFESEKYIKDIANDIDARMKFIASINAKLNQFEIAVLTAVNLSDELEREKDRGKRIAAGLNGDENHKKLAEYEETVDKLEEAEKKVLSYEEDINKYKENDIFVTQKLSDEVKKHKEVYGKLKRLEETTKEKFDELEEVKEDNKKLQNDKYDLETEIVQLKKEIEILRKESKTDDK
ncbi:MAG: cell division protein ZapA [Tissierellia bacterium]|nr:cell division protein ZapA [Tissierellia bacterium]